MRHDALTAMDIGVPREIKNHEYRVGITPPGVRTLVGKGHRVRVESCAGARIGFPDAAYRDAGAHVVASAREVYACPLVVKVKELQAGEFACTHPGQIVFCYQHFAPDHRLLQAALDAGLSCIAYETVMGSDGSLPLLVPMSQVAGRLAPQVGAWALQLANGGSGVLLGGVPGVPPARVVIIGGGIVGTHAAGIALGMGADVTLLDHSAVRLAALEEVYGARLKTALAEAHTLAALVHAADLVIGAVHLPGRRTPRVVTRDDVKRMRAGSVLVDVAIDQGGMCETSRPTSHSDPVYIEEGVVHYCVANMPAAVARTATLALTQATLPFVVLLADRGLREAVRDSDGLRAGLQVHAGRVTHRGLAEDTGRDYTDALEALA